MSESTTVGFHAWNGSGSSESSRTAVCGGSSARRPSSWGSTSGPWTSRSRTCPPGPARSRREAALARVLEFLVSLRLLRKQDEELAVTSRTRRYYFENLSTIRDERRYVAIDLATP